MIVKNFDGNNQLQRDGISRHYSHSHTDQALHFTD